MSGYQAAAEANESVIWSQTNLLDKSYFWPDDGAT